MTSLYNSTLRCDILKRLHYAVGEVRVAESHLRLRVPHLRLLAIVVPNITATQGECIRLVISLYVLRLRLFGWTISLHYFYFMGRLRIFIDIFDQYNLSTQ